ncbi:biotin-dependent carboxylase uncharacterized domain-containing protein [Streptosporangium subroseum]|uniref:Biotin-dependent carboxylase uncharacterized domain-containing protein n=1 Tax=Streptosporangium subroseum TaxID=106412 RepID=A0A239FIJ1_9ACTN|nr:biotin-dependent carboxyltransferase family protein [Streptosporangium subroseum]SNS56093.1 biotin-dependent carboxylase uncharacterized domain-containing protein [Streptosporangium subroseum]
MIEVIAPGPYTTVQDLGRPGYGHLGVPRSGAADAPSLRLANRLVGNPEGAAGVELTFGGARLLFAAGAWAAVTGAPCPVELSRPRGTVPAGMCAPFWVAPGDELRIGLPSAGLRTYVAIRGGIDTPVTMGSRSTDSLSGLGPPPLRPGTVLPVGPTGALPPLTVDAAAQPGVMTDVLRALPGPRDDWFVPGALADLCAEPYEVSQDGNRVGVRLRGTRLDRIREGELPSEGMVAGAVQVPPNGQPIVFLADHPPTGGYPVIAVLTSAALARAAQLRPGDRIRFHM